MVMEISADQEDQEDQESETITKGPGSETDWLGGIEEIERLIQEAREASPWYKFAVYGQPGVGKTRLGASFPKPLIIDCREDGTKFVPLKGVKVLKASNLRQIELTYWYLKTRPHTFQTVVIDTVTSLADMTLDFVLKEDEASGFTPEPNLPTQRTWQKVGRILGLLLLNFKDLPMHVIFLVNEKKQVQDDDFVEEGPGDTPTVFPELSPAVRSKLYRAVDIMGRLTVREVEIEKEGKKRIVTVRTLWPHSNPVFQAKDRSDKLPRAIPNPTYAKLTKYLQPTLPEKEKKQ